MFTRLLALALLFTVPGFCGRGKIRDFVYTSSKKDFTFEVPQTPFKLKCKEVRAEDHVSVTIRSGLGQSFGLERVLLPEHTMPYFKKSDEQAMSEFLGRAVMVNYNTHFPGSKIILQETRELCHCATHFVLVDKPLGNYTAEGESSKARGVDAISVFRQDNQLMIIQVGNMMHYETEKEEVVAFLENHFWKQIEIIANSYRALD